MSNSSNWFFFWGVTWSSWLYHILLLDFPTYSREIICFLILQRFYRWLYLVHYLGEVFKFLHGYNQDRVLPIHCKFDDPDFLLRTWVCWKLAQQYFKFLSILVWKLYGCLVKIMHIWLILMWYLWEMIETFSWFCSWVVIIYDRSCITYMHVLNTFDCWCFY